MTDTDWNDEQRLGYGAALKALTDAGYGVGDKDRKTISDIVASNPNEDWDTIAELALDEAGFRPSWVPSGEGRNMRLKVEV